MTWIAVRAAVEAAYFCTVMAIGLSALVIGLRLWLGHR